MTLRVEGLAIGYPGKPVGRDIAFALADGEVLCLLGPNGSGKTTLFKTILGLIPPQGGRILFAGEDVAAWPAARRARTMAYVPQAQAVFFPFTVRETVLMGRTAHLGLFAAPGPADEAAADRALAMLRIAHLADAVYGEISGGQRQLALVARALAQEPRLLVLDEPTASLDFGNQILVLEHVRALARSGIAVVLSTHDPDHAFVCADRVALIHAGRIAALGPPGATVTADTLRLLYGVEVRVVTPEGAGRPVCVPLLAP